MDIDPLKLENQLCFPLYACARKVTRLYTPFLDEIGLTYTQYIVMMVLWEEKQATARRVGERLRLDSGTLTPLLKRLEGQGLITRERSREDERNLALALTEKGEALRERAAEIPARIGACIALPAQDAQALYRLLYQVLDMPEG